MGVRLGLKADFAFVRGNDSSIFSIGDPMVRPFQALKFHGMSWSI
jgi:hypothetical protein